LIVLVSTRTTNGTVNPDKVVVFDTSSGSRLVLGIGISAFAPVGRYRYWMR